MNVTRRRAILYGDSLILQGVRAELAGIPGLEVLMLDRPLEVPLEELQALQPAVIIFDLGAIQPDFPLALLQEPGLLLIGMEPETHKARVWSGRQEPAVAATDLIGIIQKEEYGDTQKEGK